MLQARGTIIQPDHGENFGQDCGHNRPQVREDHADVGKRDAEEMLRQIA